MIYTDFNEIAWRQSSSYMVSLGLERPPFLDADPAHFFFQFPLFNQRLHMLQNLVQGNDYLALVVGDQGSGKTTLLERLIKDAKQDWRICRVRCYGSLDSESLLERIGKSFDVEDQGRASLLERINLKLHQLRSRDILPLLLLDDCHELDSQAMQVLLQVGASGDFRNDASIVAFAEPQISATLSEINPDLPKQAVINKLFMLPFNRTQTEAYVIHRLRQAGLMREKIPLDKECLDSIFTLSSGLPGKINDEAHRLLQYNVLHRPGQPFKPDPSGQVRAPREPMLVPLAAAEADDEGHYRPGWLLKQPSHLFTLQLASSRQEPPLAKLIDKHRLLEKSIICHTYNRGQDWYNLLYGLYDNRAAAEEAISALPANLRELDPWPRSLLSVQEAIRKGKKFVSLKK